MTLRRRLRRWADRAAGRPAVDAGPRVVPSPVGTTLCWEPDDRYPEGFVTGTYEPDLFALLADRLRAGDNFLDVGANAGYVSLVVKSLVGDGRVVAVEPNPDNIETINRMRGLNPELPIELVEAAACPTTGPVTLRVTRNLANSRIESAEWELAKPHLRTFTVDGRSLDDLVALASPAVIKIDIEGAEADVLAGSDGPEAWGRRPFLVVEYHGPDNCSACTQRAERWGYEAEVVPSADLPELSGIVVFDGS